MRDRARPPKTPALLASAPDRHPDGPGLQARSAQRIEQVARRVAPFHAFSEDLTAGQTRIADNPVTPGCTIDHLLVIYDPDLVVIEA